MIDGMTRTTPQLQKKIISKVQQLVYGEKFRPVVSAAAVRASSVLFYFPRNSFLMGSRNATIRRLVKSHECLEEEQQQQKE